MRVTIHQPEFMPWLGFFHKISRADVFVLLDDAQFSKNYFHNRNRVRTPTDWTWITVPVVSPKLATPINMVQIAEANNPRWRQKIQSSLGLAYKNAPFFEQNFQDVASILNDCGPSLSSLNISLIRWMMDAFHVRPKILYSSQMDIDSTGSQRILDICNTIDADVYVSGVSGASYLETNSFEQAGVRIEQQDFSHPIYQQIYPHFVPQISALEAVFLFGKECKHLLADEWPDKLNQVFT